MNLKENEWLLKYEDDYTQEDYDEGCYPAGFLSKTNKDGSIPLNFKNWRGADKGVYTEDFKTGWRLHGFRGGKSQDWIELWHPLGFTLEVWAEKFLKESVPNITIKGGEILEPCKWVGKMIEVQK